MTENTASTPPKLKAASGSTAPRGIGRPQVRFMIASMSRSNHMLMAPEAPAPTAMHSTATAPISGWMSPGATARPAKPENTTSDMTRGFSSAMKSRMLPPSVVRLACSLSNVGATRVMGSAVSQSDGCGGVLRIHRSP